MLCSVQWAVDDVAPQSGLQLRNVHGPGDH